MAESSTSFAYIEAFWISFVLAMVVSATSYTITMTDIFEPLRKGLASISPWLESLFSCFHCLSHWIAFLLIAIYRPEIIPGKFPILNYAISAFFVIQMATYMTGITFKTFGVIIPVKMTMAELKAKAAAASARKASNANEHCD